MRISDWSSDVCSSDLIAQAHLVHDRLEVGNTRIKGMHAYLETLTGQVFLHIFRQVRRGLFGGIDDRCRLDLHLVQHPDHGLLVAGRVVDAEKGFIAALHQTVIDAPRGNVGQPRLVGCIGSRADIVGTVAARESQHALRGKLFHARKGMWWWSQTVESARWEV